MKLSRIACLVAIFAGRMHSIWGQGFSDLNFEQSTIVSSSPTSFGFDTGIANVPYWTEYNGWGGVNYSGGTTILYNNQPLDNPGVSLEGPDYYFRPAIQGDYSVFLLGGTSASEGGHGAAIGQTGQIPITAQSITYWGQGGNSLQITFNGHLLAFNAIGTGPNCTIYGADISAFAGQTGELRFTAPWVTGEGLIDNIQFLTTPIPEPGDLQLFFSGLGLLFLVWLGNRADPK